MHSLDTRFIEAMAAKFTAEFATFDIVDAMP